MDFFLLIFKKLFAEKIILEHRLFIMLFLSPLMIKLALKITKPCIQGFFHAINLNKKVLHWPTADGIILESEVREGVSGANDDSQIYYYVHLVYRYFVNNKEYISPVFRMVEPLGDPESYCKEIINKYPIKSNVKVFYNPENHEESCLKQSSINEIFRAGLAMVIYCMFCFIGFPSLTYLFTVRWFLALLAIVCWIFVFIYTDDKRRKKIFKNKQTTIDS